MQAITENYIPYGEDWENEVMKLNKKDIVALLREAKTGTKAIDVCAISSIQEAQIFCEGLINDFEAGIATKDETMKGLFDYTARIMEVFWKNAKEKIRENPKLIRE